jgi:hypothetical protein
VGGYVFIRQCPAAVALDDLGLGHGLGSLQDSSLGWNTKTQRPKWMATERLLLLKGMVEMPKIHRFGLLGFVQAMFM